MNKPETIKKVEENIVSNQDWDRTRIETVLNFLNKHNIRYKIWEHPPLPTIEIAIDYWKEMPGTHCKNLFFRNHKGDQHYLVIFECSKQLNIKDLETKLNQGKLTFASPKRMEKYLGVTPGSVTPFGLINDIDHHVILFIDNDLENTPEISFHPNDNRASVVINGKDFFKFLSICNNKYHFINVQ